MERNSPPRDWWEISADSRVRFSVRHPSQADRAAWMQKLYRTPSVSAFFSIFFSFVGTTGAFAAFFCCSVQCFCNSRMFLFFIPQVYGFCPFPKTIYTGKFPPQGPLLPLLSTDNISFRSKVPNEVAVENPGLHEAGAAERCAPEAQRNRYMDSRGCLVRSQRARRLRARRSPAPEGKERWRRGRRHHLRPRSRPAGPARSPRQGCRPCHSPRRSRLRRPRRL